MSKADLVVHNAGQLLTCAGNGRAKRGGEMSDLGIISKGAVAVADGKILEAGDSETILAKYHPDKSFDAEGRAVCPGFVDPHTHIVFAGERLNEFELKIKGADYLEILANGGGIISTVKHTRAATLEHLIAESITRLDKMLAAGTTTCEIKTGYGLDLETEIKMLQAMEHLDGLHAIDIVPTFLAAHAVPPEYKDSPDRYVELICDEMLSAAWQWYEGSNFAQQGTPFFIDIFTEKNAFDLEQSAKILSAAAQFGFGVKAHVDEFTNLGGSKLAIGMEAVSIDHLDAISQPEVLLLSQSNTVGVVTPTVNFNFGSAHFADARGMIDNGCAIALSTDYNPGSAPCPSQPMSMAIACRYQKLLPAETFNAATINAAHAIGLENSKGSIEPGKCADLLVLDTDDYRSVCYEFGTSGVAEIFKHGKLMGKSATDSQ